MFRSTCDAPGDQAVGGFAQAMSGASVQAIGQIQTTSGSVTVTSASGVVVRANRGDLVCQHDTIETGADGNVGLIFNDGTAFNLSSDSRMVLSEFVYDPNGKSNSTLFSLSKGTFTFIPGKAAESTDLRIDTPVGRIRGSAREGGIGILTLAGLTFSVMDQIQAASQSPHGFLDDGTVTVGNQASSRSHAFLDDDRLTYKHLPHGGYEITMRDGRVIMHDDPGETIQIDPSGTVTHIPNSSSRMADLQNFQQAALSTLSQAPQGAAPGGSSTDTFNAPQQLLPINFTRPESGAVQNQVTVNIAPTTSGFVEVVQLQPPPPPPPTATPTIAISTIAGQISVAADNIINASKANAGVNITGTTSGIEDGEIVTITVVDSSNHLVYSTTATVTNGTWLITVSSTDAKLLADGSYLLTADVSNVAGNPAQTSQAITVDQDVNEHPSVLLNGGSTTRIGAAGAGQVAFTISGLEADDSGTLTFSDQAGHTVVVQIVSGTVVPGLHNTATTVDLSSFSDGTITSSLAVSDTAGNHFSASGNAVPLDQDLGEQLTVSFNGLTGGYAVEDQPITSIVSDTDNDVPTSGITYTWQISHDGGSTWSTVGGNTRTYTPSEADEGGLLKVLASFKDAAGNTESGSSTVGVLPLLTIANTSLSVSPNGSVTLGIALTQEPTPDDTISVTISFPSSGAHDPTIAAGDHATGNPHTSGGITTYTFSAADVGTGLTFTNHGDLSDVLTVNEILNGTVATSQTITVTDPPASTTASDATVVPVMETTTLTATETAGSQTDVPLTTIDDGIVVALNTAVSDPGSSEKTTATPTTTEAGSQRDLSSATVDDGTVVAVNATVSELNGGETTSVTTNGNGVADITPTVSASGSFVVNSATALEFTSHKIPGILTDNGTVEVTSGKLEIAGTASGTGVFKIDAGATLQLDSSDAVNVKFAGSSGTLVLDHSLTQPFSAVMSGLGAGDTIDLKDLVFTSGHMTATTSFVNGNTTLVVNNISTAQSVTLTLAGDYTHSTWDLAQDSGTGSILHNLPATNADANLNVPGSASSDLALTVTAALTIPDQFAFQDDSQSGTFAIGSASIASGKDATATHAATLDKTDNQPTGTATTTGPADSDLTSKVAMNAHPATGDTSNGTQAGTMSQTASASPAATGPNGSDTFVFSANLGHETLTNFHPATDVIEIDHTVFADVHALLAATHDDGHGNAVITTDPHDSVTLKNVTVAQLVQHQGDFHFT